MIKFNNENNNPQCTHTYSNWVCTSVGFTCPAIYNYTRTCFICNSTQTMSSDVNFDSPNSNNIPTITLEDWCKLKGYDYLEVLNILSENDNLQKIINLN